MPILAIAEAESGTRLLRGLEIGVNDYLLRPVDKNELLARARTQIRKRRYTDHLRDNVQNSIEMAITDALTGLHNRRYMRVQLEQFGGGIEVEVAGVVGDLELVADEVVSRQIQHTRIHEAEDLRLRLGGVEPVERGAAVSHTHGGEPARAQALVAGHHA